MGLLISASDTREKEKAVLPAPPRITQTERFEAAHLEYP